MRNKFVSLPRPKARQVSPAASSDGKRHAQRACFAIIKALQPAFTGEGLSTDDVWAYMLHTDGVDSRTELTERQYVLWQARLSAAQRDKGLLSILCDEVKVYHESQLVDVKAAYDTIWQANKARVLDYLRDGFDGNLSEGVVLHELGVAIRTEYAPRELMTQAMWIGLCEDFVMSPWSDDHWLHQLRRHIYRKYEDKRPFRYITYSDFTPPTEVAEQVEAVSVYLVADPKVLLYAGVRPKCLEGYCQAYANANHVTLTLHKGNETTYFISESEYLTQRGE